MWVCGSVASSTAKSGPAVTDSGRGEAGTETTGSTHTSGIYYLLFGSFPRRVVEHCLFLRLSPADYLWFCFLGFVPVSSVSSSSTLFSTLRIFERQATCFGFFDCFIDSSVYNNNNNNGIYIALSATQSALQIH